MPLRDVSQGLSSVQGKKVGNTGGLSVSLMQTNADLSAPDVLVLEELASWLNFNDCMQHQYISEWVAEQ